MAIRIISERKCNICKKPFIFTLCGGFLVAKCECGGFSLETVLSLAKQSDMWYQANILRNCFGADCVRKFIENGFLERKSEKGKNFEKVYYKLTRKFKKYATGLRNATIPLITMLKKIKNIETIIGIM